MIGKWWEGRLADPIVGLTIGFITIWGAVYIEICKADLLNNSKNADNEFAKLSLEHDVLKWNEVDQKFLSRSQRTCFLLGSPVNIFTLYLAPLFQECRAGTWGSAESVRKGRTNQDPSSCAWSYRLPCLERNPGVPTGTGTEVTQGNADSCVRKIKLNWWESSGHIERGQQGRWNTYHTYACTYRMQLCHVCGHLASALIRQCLCCTGC